MRNSPLPMLPGEPRDKIFRYALGGEQIYIFVNWDGEYLSEILSIHEGRYLSCHLPDVRTALPRVCTQLRRETSALMWFNTTTSMSNLVIWLDIPEAYWRVQGQRHRGTGHFAAI